MSAESIDRQFVDALEDPCGFVVGDTAILKEKRREYFRRLHPLLGKGLDAVINQPDSANYRSLLKLIGSEFILETRRQDPSRPITRLAVGTAFAEYTGHDYASFTEQTADWCRFTGRYMLDVPALGATASGSAATAFLVLRDYATGINPNHDLSLRFGMTEEGIVDENDPLYLAPVGKHPAVFAPFGSISPKL